MLPTISRQQIAALSTASGLIPGLRIHLESLSLDKTCKTTSGMISGLILLRLGNTKAPNSLTYDALLYTVLVQTVHQEIISRLMIIRDIRPLLLH